MLVLAKSLQNVPIMSLQNGAKLGSTVNAIIDPRKLTVVAYRAAGPRIQKESVIHTADIREFGPLGFIVDSADSVMDLDEHLVRLQEVLRLNFTLLGKSVIDEQKRKLGKVVDYALETEGFYIQKIHVGQSVLKNFTESSLIINRTQIVELNDSHIVVRAGTVSESSGLMQVLNPFRKNRDLSTAPEATHHQQS